MMQQLNLSVATLPPVPIASITPNMVCAAHSSSYMCWYRSRVSRVDSAENKVMVDFLDYGGTEIVSASKIKPLPAASFDFPLQGIWCFLYGTWYRSMCMHVCTCSYMYALSVKAPYQVLYGIARIARKAGESSREEHAAPVKAKCCTCMCL